MKNKKRIIIIALIIINFSVLGVTKTYSAYKTKVESNVSIDFAKIVFNNKETTDLSLPIESLYPGSHEEFTFQVKNFDEQNTSEISLRYNFKVETLHLIPTIINIYKVDNNTKTLVLTCGENDERTNRLISCTSNNQYIDYGEEQTDEYIIEVNFPEKDSNNEMWESNYSSIIDYINIEINSYQKK